MAAGGDVEQTLENLVEERLLVETAEELYENAPAAFISTLMDGTIVKVNETLLRWTGYQRGELVGRRRLHDLLPPGARIYYETHYAPLLHMQGQIGQIAVELVRSDGTRVPVLMNSVLVRDESGSPRVVRTTIVDASDRRRYEQELLHARADAESRARAAVALAHVAEGVLLLDEDGVVRLMNPAAEFILGVDADAAVGRLATDAFEGWEAVASRVAPHRAGAPPATDVVPLSRAGGDRWLAVAAADAGTATVYTVRDVTAERGLEQLRGEMVAIVSHELRTPISGVYGGAKTLLAHGDGLDERQRTEFLEMIVRESRRLESILDQIALTNTLDTGELRTHATEFDVSRVFDAVVSTLDAGDHARIGVDVDGGLMVSADFERLRQVVASVVDNALKYSQGHVELGAAGRESVVRLTVSDEGPGIPAAHREHVFEKFFRLDPDQTRGVGGTGLGLYIARELVLRMDGRIGLLPRERGTSVFVDVPAGAGGD